MPNKEIETFYPKNQTEWRNWLEEHHQSAQSIWVVFYKTSTNIPSITWSDAVDEALCFGWIDSTKKTIDEESYMQYFSKRKPNSNWSKINKKKIEYLIQNNLMADAGLESIKVAKENGSWTFLDPIEALEVPEDLEDALLNNQNAMAYYEGLSKSVKKILLHWVYSAKRPETRQKRITEIAECASESLVPKPFR
ncbi:YdeI/OmpD-associated family protein [Reichenbachiella ulvae]|uniref:YdeI/OmpD-associated family protein n=1 Tax=Reichenbachiella ulvae TaxID=2980104 RepID=A0ABT3CSU3_9BACT|nr:YdeI/OmpD-associated family protein [Reichenbachiella ulvae]MCV9386742.1 YdeI/OmpD-associated family protein [Reichenbachiella ulvae]